ncbi:uncharacterized protein LOC123579131 [Leopardus geoffroyi]|uniref:uncharacterized protein LOC123579131 n=1 Tax=Leopardus geoffroyi TaxID=46844 RepID=UPI001E264FD4|nr:uncharacterized protein LOC123579131 [Leopardus geoffroyi]
MMCGEPRRGICSSLGEVFLEEVVFLKGRGSTEPRPPAISAWLPARTHLAPAQLQPMLCFVVLQVPRGLLQACKGLPVSTQPARGGRRQHPPEKHPRDAGLGAGSGERVLGPFILRVDALGVLSRHPRVGLSPPSSLSCLLTPLATIILPKQQFALKPVSRVPRGTQAKNQGEYRLYGDAGRGRHLLEQTLVPPTPPQLFHILAAIMTPVPNFQRLPMGPQESVQPPSFFLGDPLRSPGVD